MAFAMTRMDELLFVLDKETGKEGVFDSKTGKRVRGKLDLPAEEVLYMAWRQVQDIRLNETLLREIWKKRK